MKDLILYNLIKNKIKKFKAQFITNKILNDEIKDKNIIQKKTQPKTTQVSMQNLWSNYDIGVTSSKANSIKL